MLFQTFCFKLQDITVDVKCFRCAELLFLRETDIITVRPKRLRCAEVLLQPGFIGTGLSGFHDTSFRIYPEADGLAECRYCHVDFCVPAFPAMKGP